MVKTTECPKCGEYEDENITECVCYEKLETLNELLEDEIGGI